jgi:hypothetical protein
MITIVKVVSAKALDETRLWLAFSDGTEGVRDCADILDEGGAMVEPLRDPALFSRVFVEFGVPTWPNGYDLDAVRLHQELADAGLLTQSAA